MLRLRSVVRSTRFIRRSHQDAQTFTKLYQQIGNTGLSQLLGIKLTNVEATMKSITFEMELSASHMAPSGLPHGGSLTALGDTAVGAGAWMCKPHIAHRVAVTDTNISFVAPATVGQTLVATATQIHSGALTQIWQADISTKEGHMVASMRATAVNIYPQKDSQEPDLTTKINQELEKKKILENKQKIGFQFNVKTQSKAEIAAKFDKHAPNWDHFVSLTQYCVFDWIGERCAEYSKEDPVILDLGCGPGLIGKFLSEKNITGTSTALDISPQMLSRALSTGVYYRGLVHDLDDPLPVQEKFDLITCFAVSEMLKSLPEFLKNIKSVMKPDGELWLSIQWDDGSGKNPLAHQGMQQFTTDQFLAICGEVGLKAQTTPLHCAYRMPTQDDQWTAVPYLLAKIVHT